MYKRVSALTTIIDITVWLSCTSNTSAGNIPGGIDRLSQPSVHEISSTVRTGFSTSLSVGDSEQLVNNPKPKRNKYKTFSC